MKSAAEVEPWCWTHSCQMAPSDFAALLTADSGLGTSGLTVVGGSAMRIYTEVRHMYPATSDLVVGGEALETRIQSWGFKDEGSYGRTSKNFGSLRGHGW